MVKKDSKMKIPLALLFGMGMGLLVSVIVAMLAAGLIAGEKLQETATGWMAMLSLFLGSLTAAVTTVGKVQQMRFAMCISAGASYLVGLFIVSVILFDGVKGGLGASVAVILGGALAAFLVSREHKRKPKYRPMKLRN